NPIHLLRRRTCRRPSSVRRRSAARATGAVGPAPNPEIRPHCAYAQNATSSGERDFMEVARCCVVESSPKSFNNMFGLTRRDTQRGFRGSPYGRDYHAHSMENRPGSPCQRLGHAQRFGSHMVRLNYSERSLRKTNPTPLHFLPAQASVSLLLSGETRVFLSFSS